VLSALRVARNNQQRGFTIVEVIVVVAVSGALLLIGVLGQGQVQDKARFTDSLETLESELESVKVSAESTSNTADVTGGDSLSEVVFGSMISFAPNNDRYNTSLLSHRDDGELSAFSAKVEGVNEKTMRWGLEYVGFCETDDTASNYCNGPIINGPSCIIYYRNLKNGRLQNVLMSGNVCDVTATGQPVDFDISNPNPSSPAASYRIYEKRMTLLFSSDSGDASLLFDPNSASGSVELRTQL